MASASRSVIKQVPSQETSEVRHRHTHHVLITHGDSSVVPGSRRARSPLHRFRAAAKPDAVPHARSLPRWQGCSASTFTSLFHIRNPPHRRIYTLLLQGFPDHPHRGQATVTYMTQGSSKHEDSAGHAGTIHAGGVQWMCAVRLFRAPLCRASHGQY